jgi:hypothetical protein
MSDQFPPSWFRINEKTHDNDEFMRRKAKLREELSGLLAGRKDRGRAKNFYPYLLVRSVLGDRGDRPINVPFWESPDIWTIPGEPENTPALPAVHEGTAMESRKPHTVYAHVWNLGFAPLAGIFVEFYSLSTGYYISHPENWANHAQLIGTARCEMAARGMPGSHKLVKCPKAWHPSPPFQGIMVRVSGIGDPIGANPWSPALNRHVAERGITVYQATGTGIPNERGARDSTISGGSASRGEIRDSLVRLLVRTDATRPITGRIQLIQVGAREGEIVRHLIAHRWRLATLDTHVLGEIDVTGKLAFTQTTNLPAGMLATVHPMAAGGAPRAPSVMADVRTRVIDPSIIFDDTASPEPNGVASLVDLFGSVKRRQAGAVTYGPPNANEAYMLRLARYSGEQLIGGHTFVIAGDS